MRFFGIILPAFILLSSFGGTSSYGQSVLVKDINPGQPGSYPFNFTPFGSKLFFHAKDTIEGFEIWSLDNNDSVKLENSIFSGIEDGFPFHFTAYGGKLLFSGSDSAYGHEMRSFDGTSVQLLADIRPDSLSSWPGNFTEYSGSLYFSARDSAHGTELWKYDGVNVSRISDINPDTLSSYPSNLLVHNGILYFAATDSTNGRELWSYNGSLVSRAADINPGSGSSNPVGLFSFNSTLLFNADNGTNGSELYSFNGSNAVLVNDIYTGSEGSFPHYFLEFNGAVYFSAIDSAHGSEVWKYDGSVVSLAVDINPGPANAYPGDLILFDNQLYLSADNGANGFEVLYLDTLDSVYVATDIYPGAESAFPVNLTIFNNALYFQAQSEDLGFELWKYTPCRSGDRPILGGDTLNVCADSNFTIAVQNADSLRNSKYWALYKDSISDTPLDSNSTGSFQLDLSSAATFIVRAEGCDIPGKPDSVHVLVNSVVSDTIYTDLCEGDTLSMDTLTITQEGWYLTTNQSAYGCDSVINLYVTILPINRDTINSVVCEGDSMMFDGNYYSTAGTYTAIYQSASGCDSVEVLSLNVGSIARDTVSAGICSGDTLVMGNLSITAPGIYEATFSRSGLCDSMVVVDVVFFPVSKDTIAASICSGQSFYFAGQNINTQGYYDDTLQSSNGCDSIVTLNLFVDQASGFVSTADVCEGSSYFFRGMNYNSSGTYYDTVPASAGCDTIFSLFLTVHPIDRDTSVLSKCSNESIAWNGNTFNAAGFYSDTLVSQFGCDSISVLELIDIPTFSTTIYDTICQGSTYLFASQVLDSSGTYTNTFTNSMNCDSTVNLELTVLPSYHDTLVLYTCSGIPYSFNNQLLYNAGIYNINIPTTYGCDSLFTIYLVVRPSYNDTTNVNLCEGDTTYFEGQPITQSGFYSHVYTSRHSCDSIVNLQANFIAHDTDTLVMSICLGDTIPFGNRNIYSAGLYTEVFQSSQGCDSSVFLYLVNRPVFMDTVEQSICEGDSIAFAGQYVNSSGTYTHVYNSRYGCDSIVTLNLQVNPVFYSVDTSIICQGQHYRIGTQIYTSTGYYSQTFSTHLGCDSTVAVQLYVNPTYSDTINRSVCAGDSLNFAGNFLNTSGQYVHSFQSKDGCDSTVTLNLTVNPTYDITIYDTICPGESLNIGGMQLKSTGLYNFNLQTSNSCDSNITVILFVKPLIASSMTMSICPGDTFRLGSQNITTAGTFTEVFQAANGCDSIVTITMGIRPTYSISLVDTICSGETIQLGSQLINSAGIYTEAFTSSQGCDSTVALNVFVNPVYSNSQNLSICDDDSLILGGIVYKTSGTYSHTFQSKDGCDSVETVQLTVLSTYHHTDTVAICAGQTFKFGNLNLTKAGDFGYTFQSITGCDSTVDLHLIVHPVYSTFDTAAICQNDTFNFGTQRLYTSGTYTEIFTSEYGCDSTVQLSLIVHPVFRDSIEVDICTGDSLNLGGQYYTIPGFYTIINETQYGCDSITRLKLNVLPTYNKTQTVSICAGSVYEFGSRFLSKSGFYFDTFQSILGCDSAVRLNLTVVDVDTSVQVKSNELISNQDNAKYQWYRVEGSRIPIAGETNQNIFVSVNGVYALKVTKGLCSAFSADIPINSVGLETAGGLKFQLFPNPNDGEFDIVHPGLKNEEAVEIEMATTSGMIVFKQIYAGAERFHIRTEDLPRGVYLLRLRYREAILVERIVIN